MVRLGRCRPPLCKVTKILFLTFGSVAAERADRNQEQREQKRDARAHCKCKGPIEVFSTATVLEVPSAYPSGVPA
jgi:hypothetical protein